MQAQVLTPLERALPLGAQQIDAVHAGACALATSLHRHGQRPLRDADQVGDDRAHARQQLQQPRLLEASVGRVGQPQQAMICKVSEGETIMGAGVGASARQATGSGDDAASADSHGLVTLRMDGVLERLVKARAHLLRGEVAAKAEAISHCVEIIGGLRGSLNPKVEPSMIGRLDSLYEYMSQRLLQANLRDDASILDEVSKLLHQVRDSWVQIAPAPISHAMGA